jgi:hypothetical protein
MALEAKSVMKYVAQKDPFGCLIAAVAMVSGQTYDAIRAMCSEHEAINDYIADDVLGELGFAVMRRYKYQMRFKRDRAVWPCEPFAPTHMVYVTATQGPHAVVMDDSGVVYDPWDRTRTSLQAAVYTQVHHIDGIFKVRL